MAIGDTTLTVVGNLTADPELRFTTAGLAVAGFTVAATPRTYDRTSGQWRDGDTLFLRCAAWRHLADHAAESLTRGTRVIVTGRLRQRTYEAADGQKRTVVELEVDEVGPSLRYATAKVTKATREQAPHPAEVAGGPGPRPASGNGGRPTPGNPWETAPPAVEPQPAPAGQAAGPGDIPPF